MASLVGNYQHVKNENLDEYFKVIGVPYIPRKMMSMTSPRLEISKAEDDKWSIRIITMMRTVELTFKIGEEFEESMPAGVTLKNVASLEEDGSLVIKSEGPNNTKVTRKYDLQDDQIILTMTHEESGIAAKRYFQKIP
ncbi:cellular retinoic acid-binding protein 2-like [Copidosoma floridanum]|uniref:cellular retinoic acid-binding protein 2-like n=1 Tax=Copidosoma floridanum TaxID=29053 RepID=UPI0006C96E30|nr:cellular retinoic acid-binding protein 2-like [Copidosoma floridanum]XP_014215594.1 cellular retinoic acid-binding protein 2-like [Copidosoma floridanum]